jgi:RNA polymerase sigma factor (TIGR02999 family)
LVDQSQPQQWENSRHFFAAAAEAMRRIFIVRARRRGSLKHGGGVERLELDEIEPNVLPMACDDLLALDEALQKLGERDARKAEVVKLRFFAGMTVSQVAKTLGISVATAENDWVYARSWLRLEMTGRSRNGP